MGMDTIELVLQIEKEFDIEIDDRIAEKIYTVGELQDYIVSLLPPHRETPRRVWRYLTKILIRDYRVPASLIKRQARIVKDLGLD